MEYFIEEHERLLRLMLKHKVRFIIIGGFAVVYHGYNRTTGDMDIWLEPSNKNKINFVRAFMELELDENSLEYLQNQDFTQMLAFHIGEEPYKTEFLTKIDRVDFTEAYSIKMEMEYFDIKIPFLHFNHLIESKILSTRLKDRADVEELQKIRNQKKDSK